MTDKEILTFKDRVILAISDGDIALKFLEEIDTSNWEKEYKELLGVLSRLMRQNLDTISQNLLLESKDRKLTALYMFIHNKRDSGG